MSDPLLDPLNDAQREAVLHGEGPLLVLAGAGSGKTRVIVHRVARLVRDEGVMPWHILAVTFTNKAAGEMKERLRTLLGADAEALWVSTFHAFGARFLRREAAAAGLPPSFPIYDTDDALRVAKGIMSEMGLADGEPITARDALARIDRWKNVALRAREVRTGELDVEGEAARAIYARYEAALQRAGAADFGDLLVKPLRLLEEDAGVRARWAGRFRHVLVDEFQDTNPAQDRLVKLLLGPKRNLCVVGDDDQAIYRWRGADVGHILEFDREFEGAKVVKLEQNYRSTRPILEAAHAVISKASRRRAKRLWTEREGGGPLQLLVSNDEHEEGQRVAWAVEAAHAQGAPWEAVAVLYRVNAQSRALEAGLRDRRIPYVIVRGTSFYERAEVRDAAAYLRLALSPRSDVDLLRVVNRPPRGVGEKSVERLQARAQAAGVALFDALGDLDAVPDLPGKARRALEGFRALVESLHARVGELEAGAAVQEVLERSEMLERLKAEGTDEAAERAENLMELLAAAREFDEATLGAPPPTDPDEPVTPPLARFLEGIALLGEADAPTPEGRVAMMTLHAAKGLEFDAVVLAGVEEGLLPYQRPWQRPEEGASRDDEDEERRLCYVGMTRARKLLALSLARRRMTYGPSGPSFRATQPSRFLGDLPPQLFGLPAGVTSAASTAQPPRIRRHPGALEGEPYIELDGEDGWGGDQDLRGAAAAGGRSPGILEGEPSRERSAESAAGGRGEGRRSSRPVPDSGPRVVYDDDPGALSPGDRVVHASMGEGTVTRVDGPGPDAKVTVAFHDRGEKRVLARFLRRA